ncbi:V-type proton ATPase subunit a [Aphelenchoides besseyi]|nr:V-type proton ATPase subunit a [Aphelenchoides besseyi]
MDAIHRSEEMCLAQLFLQNEAAYACVAELGELGVVQFRDLNPEVNPFQRKYVKEIRRCDEMERKLRFLEREIKKDMIPMLDTGENPEAPQAREMFDLEATFDKLETELREVNQNEETLRKNFAELTELKHILRKTQQFFEEASSENSFENNSSAAETTFNIGEDTMRSWEQRRLDDSERQALDVLGHEDGSPMGTSDGARLIEQQADPHNAKAQLKFVAGVIQRERLPAFERLLWRACRGNVFLRQSEIAESLIDAASGISVNKSVFIIFFQGEQLKSRVRKICEGFNATLYPCPDTPQERREMSIGVMTRIEDLKTVLGQTQDHRHRVLVAAAKNVRMWMAKAAKIKAIYHTLNLLNLEHTQKCLIAECWCPVADLDRIQMALKRGSEESGSTVPSILNRMETTEQPPTFHRTNKFTRGFQNIVDAYGIASYREINPAPYTMISFPFLFALMFGDLGHGIIMFLAAAFLILKEKHLESARIKDEIFQTFFGGRYVIVLMGIFSIYTGLIYNDCFSKSFNLFGSSFLSPFSDAELRKWADVNPEETKFLVPEHQDLSGGPYPIGVDPVWNLAEQNKLNFLNSMKMKGSVLIGITQMTFGVILSYHNHKYFNSRLDILYMFIPQMIFLSSIFIYLCLEILAKWIFFSATPGYVLGYYYPGSNCAPSLLIGLINMFMMKSRESGFVVDNKPGGDTLDMCHLNYWWPGQPFFERLFLLAAMFCVPVMLFAKPYFLWKENKDRGGGSPHQQLAVAERVLIGLSVIVIPVMLFMKPFCLWLKNRKKPKLPHHNVLIVDSADADYEAHPQTVRADVDDDSIQFHSEEPRVKPSGGHGHGHVDGPFDLGDTMVYQAIHTIEFVLGCISHTASYLRLWALSLAHAQLSDVLWSMVFRQSLASSGYVGAVSMYLIFFVFGTLTISILVLMEGLSAFLHALRLHWVEFQSKFYVGQGYEFTPFSFEKILEETRAEEDAI